jgi:hypothetical protein
MARQPAGASREDTEPPVSDQRSAAFPLRLAGQPHHNSLTHRYQDVTDSVIP